MIDVSYINPNIVLDFNDTVMLTLEVAGTNIWKSFVLTSRRSDVSLYSATGSSSADISPKDFLENFSAVIIGKDFSGLLQDIVVYDSPFEGFMNLPDNSEFLPQCYCQSSSSLTSTGQCSAGEKIEER